MRWLIAEVIYCEKRYMLKKAQKREKFNSKTLVQIRLHEGLHRFVDKTANCCAIRLIRAQLHHGRLCCAGYQAG